MKSSIALTVVLTTLVLVGGHSSSSTVNGLATPTPTPTPWPNLTTLNNFPNPSGNNCTIDGAAQPGSEKAKLNDLKNRFRLPTGPFQSISFGDLLALNQGHVITVNHKKKIVGFPTSSNPNNQRAVTLTGFVQLVFVGGCERHGTGGGESCNCNTTVNTLCDTHINVLPQQGVNSAGGRNTYIVEVTERSRRLAAQGLLASNIGNDWSTATLKSKLEGHVVEFSGFLFFDTDHAGQAWKSDPHNNIDGDNFRQTAWEVHPVMGIRLVQ
jgi:hypothetical protein